MLKNLEDESHVETRICQYEALKNGKGTHIAKQLVLGRIEGQNLLLDKYDLSSDDSIIPKVRDSEETDLKLLRRRLAS
jgi:CRISPR/Cas system-associated endonuclease Cas1